MMDLGISLIGLGAFLAQLAPVQTASARWRRRRAGDEPIPGIFDRAYPPRLPTPDMLDLLTRI